MQDPHPKTQHIAYNFLLVAQYITIGKYRIQLEDENRLLFQMDKNLVFNFDLKNRFH